MRLMKMAIVASALLASGPLRAQPAAGSSSIAGTWDVSWQARSGATKRGTLVIRQEGSRIAAEVHGEGNSRASGTIEGSRFTLRGSRFLVPYTLSGSYDADRIDGEFRMLRMLRNFTGNRR